MKKIAIFVVMVCVFGIAIFFIFANYNGKSTPKEISYLNNKPLNFNGNISIDDSFHEQNLDKKFKQENQFFLFSPSDSDENKIKIIESFYDSEKMRGKTNEIVQLLLQEKNSFVIKSLSKLLMLSLIHISEPTRPY